MSEKAGYLLFAVQLGNTSLTWVVLQLCQLVGMGI